MRIKKLHRWDLSYSQAIELQRHLASQVRQVQLKRKPRTVAGLDCAFSRDGTRIIAGVVVLHLPELESIETVSATRKASFPYIPGLLSFREAPVCLAAVEKLRKQPDIFMIDGQGIAHPRRLGLAAHLGLFFNRPTVGCAKSRLTGEFEEPSSDKGSHSILKDGNEVIGAVVRTRSHVKPVFVSIGNQCLLKEAIEFVLSCATKYRLPEPTRLAHQFVSKLKLKT